MSTYDLGHGNLEPFTATGVADIPYDKAPRMFKPGNFPRFNEFDDSRDILNEQDPEKQKEEIIDHLNRHIREMRILQYSHDPRLSAQQIQIMITEAEELIKDVKSIDRSDKAGMEWLEMRHIALTNEMEDKLTAAEQR